MESSTETEGYNESFLSWCGVQFTGFTECGLVSGMSLQGYVVSDG